MNYRLNAYNDKGKQRPIQKSARALEMELGLPHTAINNGLNWLKEREWIDIVMVKNTSTIYLNEDKIHTLIWQHWKQSQDPQPYSAPKRAKRKPVDNVDDEVEPIDNEAEPRAPANSVGYSYTPFESFQGVPFT